MVRYETDGVLYLPGDIKKLCEPTGLWMKPTKRSTPEELEFLSLTEMDPKTRNAFKKASRVESVAACDVSSAHNASSVQDKSSAEMQEESKEDHGENVVKDMEEMKLEATTESKEGTGENIMVESKGEASAEDTGEDVAAKAEPDEAELVKCAGSK